MSERRIWGKLTKIEQQAARDQGVQFIVDMEKGEREKSPRMSKGELRALEKEKGGMMSTCECLCELHEKFGPGPAIQTVTRDGKRMKVCSRCTLPDDSEEEILVDLDAEVLLAYDSFGAKALLPELLGPPGIEETVRVMLDIFESGLECLTKKPGEEGEG